MTGRRRSPLRINGVYCLYANQDGPVKDSDKARSASKSTSGKAPPRVGKTLKKSKDKQPAEHAKARASIDAEPAPTERIKLVRDSFTMPRDEYELIAHLKLRALEFKRPTKKSELLRAGLRQLSSLDEARLHAALAALRPLPTGRPKKKR